MEITIPFMRVTLLNGDSAMVSVEQIADVSQKPDGGCYINMTNGRFVKCRENLDELFPEQITGAIQ